MKKFLFLMAICLPVSCQNAKEESLEAEITNGLIAAKLHLPDAEKGYYRGSRFDWSGVIPELKYDGHDYFGQWFRDYNPTTHDAICGPVEEFLPLGYEEAPVNGEFVRIGIGGLRKPAEAGLQRFGYYELVNPGQWKIKRAKDHVVFTHHLKDVAGYAYEYQKTVRLIKGKPQMVLAHRLKNTGKKAIRTNVYNHNFFTLDHQPVGPGIVVKFAYPLGVTSENPAISITGSQLEYMAESRRPVYFDDMTGHSQRVEDYDFRLENHNTGCGVRITADRPVLKIAYWSSTLTQCPEPYMEIDIQPGESFTWDITYDFYTF
ncbi:MAG: hypothetical protein LBE79_05085 [Tannerella sp.]|jgi:hypothetical protein|nr:hypothetical protein [Tannerella sp.]